MKPQHAFKNQPARNRFGAGLAACALFLWNLCLYQASVFHLGSFRGIYSFWQHPFLEGGTCLLVLTGLLLSRSLLRGLRAGITGLAVSYIAAVEVLCGYSFFSPLSQDQRALQFSAIFRGGWGGFPFFNLIFLWGIALLALLAYQLAESALQPADDQVKNKASLMPRLLPPLLASATLYFGVRALLGYSTGSDTL